MSAPQANEAEKNIEIWKVKKLIKRLEQARGNGTSMISLIIREFHSIRKRALIVRQYQHLLSQPQRIKFLERRECWLKNSYALILPYSDVF